MYDRSLVRFFIFCLVLVYQVDDSRSFPCSGWPIEDQIGEIVLVEYILKNFTVQWVENNIVELCGAIFLDPGDILFGAFCHGK
jgi:hypothetical protein